MLSTQSSTFPLGNRNIKIITRKIIKKRFMNCIFFFYQKIIFIDKRIHELYYLGGNQDCLNSGWMLGFGRGVYNALSSLGLSIFLNKHITLYHLQVVCWFGNLCCEWVQTRYFEEKLV